LKIKSPNKKGAFQRLSFCFAERTLPSSNLKPLNELETSRLEKAISPHKISGLKEEALAEVFLRDLAAINEFLFYVEAEPFITPEKAENHKRVAFKKVQAA
jgi:hypothetical protein